MPNLIKLLSNSIGWIIEKGLFYLFFGVIALILFNQTILFFNESYGLMQIEVYLKEQYQVLILPNIGTITTIASVFVGIYVTVLSILGSIRANSLMALLDDRNLKKLVKFIRDAIISSFVVIFYSLIAAIVHNGFIQSFLYFTFLILMLLTALRFGANILIIYSHDLNKLKANIDADKKEKERLNHIFYQLEQYLNEKETEALKARSAKTADLFKSKFDK
jgi:cell division protein FtsL